jgi:DUF4097 and DUF4098 domain-containing protein YvlB
MFRYVAALLYAYSAVALGASLDVSRVNGSIHVDEGEQAGDVSTVNGSITIGPSAQVREVETVNGSVRFEARATAESAETVNGSVTLGEEVEIRDSVSAVNGEITVRRGARIGGSLENVNGKLNVEGAQVGGGIETVSGDILVASGSRVDGGITVDRNHGWSSGGWAGKSRRPRVTIESGAVVNGPLHFEREVDLYVGAGVELGPVEGVAPSRHGIP